MAEQQQSYKKARFFKCALQVNPADYIKYRGQQQRSAEDEYNQQLVNAAREAGIDIIGLADHGSVNGFEKIKDLCHQHGIVVFPGFEVASSEKIHFVCLFDESASSDLITMHLGDLDVDISKPEEAFLDAGSRVHLNSDKPESYASAIERIRFVGGYLNSVDIELSDQLNAVIGGRGTGKSTLLECIRYAFALEPKTQNALKQHKSVIDTNLGKKRGMVEIKLRSSVLHGRKFTVNRKYGNQPVVVDEQGNVSPYHPTDLLPGIELYGQNEIYEMTRDEHSRNQLIERFLEGEHEQLDADIAKVLAKLKENRESIKRALNQKDDVEAEVERLPKLLDQAKQYQALGIEEKLKIIPKLEKEKQLKARVDEEVGRVKDAIESLKDSLSDTVFLSDSALESLPHAELLKQQRGILDALKTGVQQALRQLKQLALNADTQLAPLKQSLSEKQQNEEQNLEKAFKDIPASQGKTGRQIGAEYQTLLKQIEQIRPKQTTLQHRQAQINELYNQRKKLLLELDQHTSARANSILKSVKRLTKKLEQKVQLTLPCSPKGTAKNLLIFSVDVI